MGCIQVQYTQFTGTNSVSVTGSTDTALTDLTVNITPASINSVMSVFRHISLEIGLDQNNSFNHTFFFFRDTTKLSTRGGIKSECRLVWQRELTTVQTMIAHHRLRDTITSILQHQHPKSHTNVPFERRSTDNCYQQNHW